MDGKFSLSAYSALFRAVKNSMFINDGVSNKIYRLENDKKDLNMKIFNEKRLKSILFDEIRTLYNNRINFHELNLRRLGDGDLDNFSIEKFSFVENDEEDDKESGYYKIFPRTFRCNECGDFRIFHNNDEWKKFKIGKCRVPGCNGSYIQVPFIGFCETCGEISNIFLKCDKHGSDHLKLVRKDINAPSTWKIRCALCDYEKDMMSFCNHKNYTLSNNKNASKLRAINVNDGSIFKSVVKTTIDIPEYGESEDIDIILFGEHIHYWDKYFDDENLTSEDKIKFIILCLNMLDEYPTEEDRKTAISMGMLNSGFFKKGENIRKDICNFKEKHNFSYSDFNDYFILKKRFFRNEKNYNVEFNDYIKNDEGLLKKYTELKQEMGIEEVTYIPDIHIISSSIGVIKGINKSDEGIAPHFEPHWKKYNEKKSFTAVSYPFETEGIMFDLDKERLVKWIIDNSDREWDKNISAEEFLSKLDEDSEEYKNLKTLIHTFSHILINRASSYTGLNSDSCGELLFPKAGSFLIYSTSNINIGGFYFVFENLLFEWFNNVKLEINDCVFDPTCMDENGACFSCVYLPEYVCSHFNNFLDRDAFLGEIRFKKGYWK